ncbi:MAG: helix-turn-helix domain-containing protein [Candidatus Merdivicinus sp.]
MVSNLREWPNKIPVSYREVLNGMGFAEDHQRSFLFCGGELPATLSPYPAELKQRIMELALSGKVNELREILYEMYRNSTFAQLQMLESILNYMMSEVAENSGLLSPLQLQEFQNINYTGTTKRKMEMCLQLLEKYGNHTEEAIPERKENRQEQIALRVQKYIRENYSNQDLNVSGIGVEFDLSPYYLSKIFKEVTGQTILRCIDMQRLEKAQELLLTSLPLASVAEQCGYTDSHALIRAFKKQFGITPGRYKELNQPNESK